MFTIYSGWFCIDITQKAGEREVQSRKLLLFSLLFLVAYYANDMRKKTNTF